MTVIYHDVAEEAFPTLLEAREALLPSVGPDDEAGVAAPSLPPPPPNTPHSSTITPRAEHDSAEHDPGGVTTTTDPCLESGGSGLSLASTITAVVGAFEQQPDDGTDDGETTTTTSSSRRFIGWTMLRGVEDACDDPTEPVGSLKILNKTNANLRLDVYSLQLVFILYPVRIDSCREFKKRAILKQK